MGMSSRWKNSTRLRDQIGFWLSILVLCLLPIEWLMLPFRLKVADFALVLLTLYGLGKAWRTHQRLEFPLLLPIWLILLASLIATLVGFAHPDSIMAIVQEVYLFTWFIVLSNVLKTFPLSDLDRLMKIWSVIALAEAATTLMGMLRIGPRLFSTEFGRAVGTYVNPNAAAAYLSVSFFVLLATSWPIWLRSVFGIWLLAGMFGTGSMGALFATIGSLAVLAVVYPIVKNRQATTLWGGVVGVGVGILGVMLFILSLWPSLLPDIGLDTSGQLFAITVRRFPRSLAGRLTTMEQAWSVYSLHPWGIGPATSYLHIPIGISLHNDFLAFAVERGPLGFIGWLWLVGSTLLAPLRTAYQCTDRHQRWRVLVLGAGFLACAMNALTHEVSHFRQVWVLMAFLFAVGYAPNVRPTRMIHEQR
jgi:hypothetical protein